MEILSSQEFLNKDDRWSTLDNVCLFSRGEGAFLSLLKEESRNKQRAVNGFNTVSASCLM